MRKWSGCTRRRVRSERQRKQISEYRIQNTENLRRRRDSLSVGFRHSEFCILYSEICFLCRCLFSLRLDPLKSLDVRLELSLELPHELLHRVGMSLDLERLV